MKTATLDDLLIQPVEVELMTGKMVDHKMQSLKVYVRRLTQVEKDLCTAHARRASRDMRKILEDESTEEHQLLIEDELSEYDEVAMRNAWVNSKLVERAVMIHRQSLEDRDQTYVPEPEGDGVMPEDVERYENEVDEVEEQREKNVADAIQTSLAQLQEEAAAMPLSDLRGNAAPTLVNAICTDIFTNEYVAQMICRGTYLDKEFTKPAFKTSIEVKRLAPSVLELLSNSHQALLIDPEAVKNLAGNLK